MIGAGLSGLVAAIELQKKGFRVLVLEKSKGLGGRMATRRDGEATFDHGAQYLKVSASQPMPEFLKPFITSEVLHPWFTEGRDTYMSVNQGMSRLAKLLAQGIAVEREKKVVRIDRSRVGLTCVCDDLSIHQAGKVICSSPLPQSLEILRASSLEYPTELAAVPYAKAIVGLFEMSADLPDLAFEQLLPALRIQSISNQRSKGTSSSPALSVVMTPQWSEACFDKPEAETLLQIQDELSLYLDAQKLSVPILRSQLKKWRYSHPLSTYSKMSLSLSSEPRITLIGDAFGGPSLLGAIRSAQSLKL